MVSESVCDWWGKFYKETKIGGEIFFFFFFIFCLCRVGDVWEKKWEFNREKKEIEDWK